MNDMVQFTATGEEASQGHIYYGGGYKYQLRRNAVAESKIRLDKLINHEYFAISVDGVILVRRGYAWDGASFIAVDDPGTIYASVFHDAGYQALRLKLLDEVWREELDLMYEALCKEGGVNRIRAKAHYVALRIGGGYYNSRPESDYPTRVAPG